jgi:hypothetical protein
MSPTWTKMLAAVVAFALVMLSSTAASASQDPNPDGQFEWLRAGIRAGHLGTLHMPELVFADEPLHADKRLDIAVAGAHLGFVVELVPVRWFSVRAEALMTTINPCPADARFCSFRSGPLVSIAPSLHLPLRDVELAARLGVFAIATAELSDTISLRGAAGLSPGISATYFPWPNIYVEACLDVPTSIDVRSGPDSVEGPDGDEIVASTRLRTLIMPMAGAVFGVRL